MDQKHLQSIYHSTHLHMYNLDWSFTTVELQADSVSREH